MRVSRRGIHQADRDTPGHVTPEVRDHAFRPERNPLSKEYMCLRNARTHSKRRRLTRRETTKTTIRNPEVLLLLCRRFVLRLSCISGRTESLTRTRAKKEKPTAKTNKRRDGGNRGPLSARRFPPRLGEPVRQTAALTSAPRCRRDKTAVRTDASGKDVKNDDATDHEAWTKWFPGVGKYETRQTITRKFI